MSRRVGYTEARQCGLAKPQIQRIAEGLSKALEYEPGGDLVELVRRLGGRVTVETTLLNDPEHTGSLYVDSERDFEIIVPSHTSMLRDRFTIAHELGHYFMHYIYPQRAGIQIPEKVVALRKGSNRIEWEANWFAAAFLMPASDFASKFNDVAGNLEAVAEHFEVSRAAADVRSRDLGLA